MMARSLFAAIFLVSSVMSACAQLVDATDPKQLASVIQDLGYKAKLEADKVGDPMIVGRHLGYNYKGYFYGCKDKINCYSITFRAGKVVKNRPFPMEKLNKWALNKRMGLIFIDNEGDPNIKYTINLVGGVSKQNFEDNFELWHALLNDFEKFIDE